jgi:uncharacterized membrane protein YidH (DUF202 family)
MLARITVAQLLLLVAFLLPFVAFAAEPVTIPVFLGRVRGILDALIPFIIGLAVFVIIWGIFNYVAHAAEEEKRAEARSYIVWGIVGVFFMISIWGFVTILINTLGVGSTIDARQIPTVPEFTPAE